MIFETAVIIPARFASTRLPGKPLIKIADKQLIQWVYEKATQIPGVKQVLVATDDERIVKAVEDFGGEVLITPDHFLSGTERVAFVAREISAEIIINLQGDEPLISPDDIGKAINFLHENPDIPVATLACPLPAQNYWLNPAVVKVLTDVNDRALIFSRAPIPFFREDEFHSLPRLLWHIGVYIFRRHFLLEFARWKPSTLELVEKLEQLRILENGYPIQVIRTEDPSRGVDTPEDIEIVTQLLRKRGN